jgi:hypothetical protein
MSRRRSRRVPRRWLIGCGIALGVLLLVWGAFVWHDLRGARSELVTARKLLRKEGDDPASIRTPEGRARADATLVQVQGHINAADHTLNDSPPLALTRLVPGLSTQRDGLLRLVSDSRVGTQIARRLLASVETASAGLKLTGGAIPLDKLGDVEAAARDAGNELRPLVRSPGGLWGSLWQARRDFDDQATSASDRLLQAADGLSAARTFLGAQGPRRYLVAIQNNAEMRDQGMVLSFAVIDVANGQVTFVRNDAISALTLKEPAPTPIPPGTQAVFGSISPTRLWQSVNATADFAWSGRAMSDMYRQATGEPIDGVIAVDVPALATVLRAVGPTPVPGLAKPLTAQNVDDQLLHALYQYAPDDKVGEKREHDVTLAIGRAVIERLARGSFDALALGQDLGKSASGGHLRLWSRVPAEEQAFERSRLGGGPAVADADRTFHLAVENRTATKLDFYVRPIVRQDVTIDGNGTATIKTTVTVENKAPAGPPSVQLGPDAYGTNQKPGDYNAWVLLWGPAGSTQDASVVESGLQLTQSVILVQAGQSVPTASITTVIPNAVRDGRLDLRYVPQPRVNPAQVTVTLDAPGWRVDGARIRHVTWDRVQRLSWAVTR